MNPEDSHTVTTLLGNKRRSLTKDAPVNRLSGNYEVKARDPCLTNPLGIGDISKLEVLE